MPKIIITIQDHESGNVKIDCEPAMEKLISAAKHKTHTPAGAYAIVALSAMIGYSGQLEKEKRGLDGHIRTHLTH